MGDNKLETTRQLQRLAALPYNPYFRDKVKVIRKVYRIQIGKDQSGLVNIDRIDWIAWIAFYAKNRPNEEIPRFIQQVVYIQGSPESPAQREGESELPEVQEKRPTDRSFTIHCSRGEQLDKVLESLEKEILPELSLGFTSRLVTEDDLPKAARWYLSEVRKHKKAGLWYSMCSPRDRTTSSGELGEVAPIDGLPDSPIAFERDVLKLMESCGIPLRFLSNILQYVLVGAESALHRCAYGVETTTEEIMTRGELELKVTVMGVNLLTTLDDWVAVWRKDVQLRLDLFRGTVDAGVGTKRRTTEFLRNQMRRYSEWYQLSQAQGRGPAKALRVWLKDHPEQDDDPATRINESTVIKGIKEFEEIIKPLSTND